MIKVFCKRSFCIVLVFLLLIEIIIPFFGIPISVIGKDITINDEFTKNSIFVNSNHLIIKIKGTTNFDELTIFSNTPPFYIKANGDILGNQILVDPSGKCVSLQIHRARDIEIKAEDYFLHFTSENKKFCITIYQIPTFKKWIILFFLTITVIGVVLILCEKKSDTE